MSPAAFLALHAVGPQPRVGANSCATACFRTPELAREFRKLVMERYHPAAYGTSCNIAPADDGLTSATWTIFSAD